MASNNRNVSSHCRGGQKYEMEMTAGPCCLGTMRGILFGPACFWYLPAICGGRWLAAAFPPSLTSLSHGIPTACLFLHMAVFL